MQKFAEEYTQEIIGQQAVDKLPWGYVLAKYTLRDMTKLIGLAEYRLTESSPENLKTALPTIEELEAELSKDIDGTVE